MPQGLLLLLHCTVVPLYRCTVVPLLYPCCAVVVPLLYNLYTRVFFYSLPIYIPEEESIRRDRSRMTLLLIPFCFVATSQFTSRDPCQIPTRMPFRHRRTGLWEPVWYLCAAMIYFSGRWFRTCFPHSLAVGSKTQVPSRTSVVSRHSPFASSSSRLIQGSNMHNARLCG